MEIALGVLGWTPETFWQATTREFWSAWAGWRRANVSSKDHGKIPEDEIDGIRAVLDDERGKVYKPGKGREATAAEIIRLVR